MGSVRYGRYETIRLIATGGMASVYLGRATGAGGFERLVAIKVMHAHIAHEREFISMFLDEARLAAKIRHPHVVPTLDVAPDGRFIVMEYVEGTSLYAIVKSLRRREGAVLPVPCALRIILDGLAGLHAAHELKGDDGACLNLVHRDVSPQNVLVGVDGSARITDFGVAHATSRITSTRGGQLKGKLPYMAPEQLRSEPVDRRTDVYAAGVVLWEVLTGRSLFRAANDAALACAVLAGPKRSPRQLNGAVPASVDEVVMQAIRPIDHRFRTAEQFAEALEDAAQEAGVPIARRRVVAGFAKDAVDAEEPPPDWSEPMDEDERTRSRPSAPSEFASAPPLAERRDSAIVPGGEPEPPTAQRTDSAPRLGSEPERPTAGHADSAIVPGGEPEPPTVEFRARSAGALLGGAEGAPAAGPPASDAVAAVEAAAAAQASTDPAVVAAQQSKLVELRSTIRIEPTGDGLPPGLPGVAKDTTIRMGDQAPDSETVPAGARSPVAGSCVVEAGALASAPVPVSVPVHATPVSGVSPALAQPQHSPSVHTPVSGVSPALGSQPSWPGAHETASSDAGPGLGPEPASLPVEIPMKRSGRLALLVALSGASLALLVVVGVILWDGAPGWFGGGTPAGESAPEPAGTTPGGSPAAAGDVTSAMLLPAEPDFETSTASGAGGSPSVGAPPGPSASPGTSARPAKSATVQRPRPGPGPVPTPKPTETPFHPAAP